MVESHRENLAVRCHSAWQLRPPPLQAAWWSANTQGSVFEHVVEWQIHEGHLRVHKNIEKEMRKNRTKKRLIKEMKSSTVMEVSIIGTHKRWVCFCDFSATAIHGDEPQWWNFKFPNLGSAPETLRRPDTWPKRSAKTFCTPTRRSMPAPKMRVNATL